MKIETQVNELEGGYFECIAYTYSPPMHNEYPNKTLILKAKECNREYIEATLQEITQEVTTAYRKYICTKNSHSGSW